MSDPIDRIAEVRLRDPVMIVAFKGWNDAGDAATFAASHLVRVWDGKRIASFDPEEFYDFQSVRPQVELIDGVTRSIVWPANDVFAAKLPGSVRDALLLVGVEPNHRWRTFSRSVVGLAKEHGVRLMITLGSLLADVPHSRPVPVTGTAGDQELRERLGLTHSRYEGPTGIVGVLHDACAAAGLPSASLWAAVPHYLAVNPNPKAALALVNQTVALAEAAADIDGLERATVAYEERVGEIVAADEDVESYVKLLEARADEKTTEELGARDLPSGDSLAAQFERYLAEREEGT